jgi:hypothetical protein
LVPGNSTSTGGNTFGSYAANNKLPYTENGSLDLQYQLLPKTVASVGNHGVHRLCLCPSTLRAPYIGYSPNSVAGSTVGYKTDLVLGARLSCEAMPPTDHTHHFKAVPRQDLCVAKMLSAANEATLTR